MNSTAEWSHVTFNRIMTEDIDLKLSYNGPSIKDTLFVALDGVMEGLAASIINKIGLDNLTPAIYKKEYARIREQFNTHLAIKRQLLSEIKENESITLDKANYINTVSCFYMPSNLITKVPIFNDESSFIDFDNEIDVGYHILTLNGTAQSIEYALSFLVYSLLANEFGVHEKDFDELFQWMEQKTYENITQNDPDSLYFEKYVNPWINALKQLD